MGNPTIVILGAGPQLGAAIARRFGGASYDVGLIARGQSGLDRLGRSLQAEGITAGWCAADMTDDAALAAAVERLARHTGGIDVLHFNPSAFTAKDPLQLTAADLLGDLHLGVASLLTAVQAARPLLRPGARVTATGSMTADHPWAQAASLGVQKAGLRSLIGALDQTLAPLGIRAMSLTVAGTIAAGTPFDPAAIAEALFDAVRRPDDAWTVEVVFRGSPS